ncbi:MAG: hypothetical protein ACI8P3_002901 [Saprospiraceae bacterium]|jgi:hypothetical protein
MNKIQDKIPEDKSVKEKKKEYSLVPSNIEELWMHGVKSEKVYRVKTARVFCADYDLIRDHFPDLNDENFEKAYPGIMSLPADIKEKTIRQKIDDWLLYNTAFISEKQAAQTFVNKPIEVSEESTTAWRPPKYGRALVYSMAQIRKDIPCTHNFGLKKEKLLDVKGCGVGPDRRPSFETHADGLLKLSDSLLEYSSQALVDGVFRHSKSNFKTIPLYAIIDLGFDKLGKHGARTRASLMIRQPHRRPLNPGGLPTYGSIEQDIQLEVELLLRKYGITSVNSVTTVSVYNERDQLKIAYGGFPINITKDQTKNIREVSRYKKGDGKKDFDGVNVQLTRELVKSPSRATLVDFGTYRVKRKFDNPILSLVRDKLMRWGGSVFPNFPNFPQPDPNFCVPAEIWGDEGEIWGYKTRLAETKQDFFCEGIAEMYRSGELTSEQVMGKLEAYIQTATSRWEK